MKKYLIKLAYEGTNYIGWQIQKTGISIQEKVQIALSTVLRSPTTIVGAGRTDGGVHALGQVAHFTSENEIEERRIRYALNSILPYDIRILTIEEVPLSFHARYSATGKVYHYHFSFVNDPFSRYTCYHIKKPLDLNKMQEAFPLFLGKKDFTSFCNVGSSSTSPIKTLRRIELKEDHHFRIELEADGFLYKMVRNIVGTLFDVGNNKYPPQAMEEILSSRDRKKAGRAAPAHGLFLIEVFYH